MSKSKNTSPPTFFCDYCVHFKPTDDPKVPNEELCEFKRELSFWLPRDYNDDSGFYRKGCKDYERDKE